MINHYLVKKLFFSALITIFTSLVVFVIAEAEGPSAPHIKFDQEKWDFGEIHHGEKVTHIFRVKNTGDADLIIQKVRSSCGCAAVILASSVIKPGKSSEIKVVFDSENYIGKVNKYIYVESNDPEMSHKTLTITAEIESPSPEVRMYFFYSWDCQECLEIKNNYLPRIMREYSPLIKIKYFEMGDPDNYKLMTELEREYGMIENPPPTIFIGDKLLDGGREIRENLKKTIKFYLDRNGCNWPGEEEPVNKTEERINIDKRIIEKFKYLSVVTVIGAGLIDGINPCAFSTIIIFVLYLTFVGYKRREILKVGIIFTIAVFLAYFFIGVGLLESVRKIEFLPTLDKIIILVVGIVAIILGFLSLYDFYKIKKGKLKEITLQLPAKIKDKIKKLIWKGSSRKHYLTSSFVIGFLVGILEFPCTGQIYFPIVIVLRETPPLRIHALSYLILYNLMFIVPLLVVFALVFCGATSNKLTNFLEKRSGMVKILTAILFFTLGTILIFLKIG